MRDDGAVETSRRDVSNHAAHRTHIGHPPHKIARPERRANQNNDAPEQDHAAIETPHRGISTPDDAALYKKKYRVPSTRLPGWDYTANAYYFVTICTRDQANTLGRIEDGRVILSPAGRIADEEWRKTSEVRPDVVVDEFVVMPNHIHGILIIDRGHESSPRQPSAETPSRGVSTSLLVPGSLGAIVGQFKSVCTKHVRHAGMADFGWQPRFYDHIIRDEDSFDRIRQYIAENPLKWESDGNTPENLWI